MTHSEIADLAGAVIMISDAHRTRVGGLRRLVVASVLLAVVVGACGDAGSVEPVSARYSPESALTVTSPSGAEVFIPAGAANKGFDVTVAVPPPTRRPGPAVTVVGDGVAISPSNPGLTMPATVSVPIVPSRIPTGATMNDVVVAQVNGDVIVPLPTRRPGMAVVAETTTFGDFFPIVMMNGDGGVVSRDAAADEEAGLPPPCTITEPFGVPVPVPGLNTIESELARSMSPDELTVYYHATNSPPFDIWRATRVSPISTFTSVEKVMNVTTSGSEASPAISADGLSLVFTRDLYNGTNWDLYRATRADTSSSFSAGDPLIASPSHEYTPFLTQSGNLYFVTGTPHTIHFAAKNGASFSTPVPLTELGPGWSPAVSASELEIYFVNAAETDPQIYVATRASTSVAFGAPTLVPNVNSTASDAPFHVSADGCRLYITTTRNPSALFDVYVATRPLVE